MKRYLLLTMLVFPAAWLRGEEAHAPAPAPRLVPRAIPGMPALPAPEPPQKLLLPLVSRASATEEADADTRPSPAKSERAQIVYIHRRETLPDELTKDLPERKKQPAAPAKVQVQVRDAAIKIIPKSEVEKLNLSKN